MVPRLGATPASASLINGPPGRLGVGLSAWRRTLGTRLNHHRRNCHLRIGGPASLGFAPARCRQTRSQNQLSGQAVGQLVTDTLHALASGQCVPRGVHTSQILVPTSLRLNPRRDPRSHAQSMQQHAQHGALARFLSRRSMSSTRYRARNVFHLLGTSGVGSLRS